MILGTSKQHLVKTLWLQEKLTPETYTVECVETKNTPVLHLFFFWLAMVISDGVKCTTIDRDGAREYNTDLKSDHEEAGNKLLLHTYDASRQGLSVTVLSENADVLIVAVLKSQILREK